MSLPTRINLAILIGILGFAALSSPTLPWRLGDRAYRVIKNNVTKACIYGTYYPPEYRKETSEFNLNSPVFYCRRYLKHKDDSIVMDINIILGGRR